MHRLRIKPLVWKPVGNHSVTAETAAGLVYISLLRGYMMRGVEHRSVEHAKAMAQEMHEDALIRWFENDPINIKLERSDVRPLNQE